MKWQRVHTLKVRWEETAGPPTAASLPRVVVRPAIPGALVTPQEQTLDPAADAPEVTFYVTPVALGTLPDPRVEVIPAGGKPEAISLPMKSLYQRLTKVLLLLTFVVSAFLLYLKYEPLEASLPLPKYQELFGGGVNRSPKAKLPRPREGNDQKAPRVPINIPLNPGQALEYHLRTQHLLPDIPEVTNPLAHGLGVAYLFLWNLSESDPVAFYVGLILLLLTGISWVTHLSARGRRRSRPIPLSPPEVSRRPPGFRAEEPTQVAEIRGRELEQPGKKGPPAPAEQD
jgi:hypothetical protein